MTAETLQDHPTSVPAASIEVAGPVPGTVVWRELLTTHPTASLDFYQRVFGWHTSSMDLGPEMGDYTLYKTHADAEPADVGGTMAAPEGTPSHWLNYHAVDDVDRMAEQIVQLGGTVISPPTTIPVGRMAIALDPAGAPFAIFKSSGMEASETDSSPAPAARTFCWQELIVDDIDTAIAFYGGLFGWTTGPVIPYDVPYRMVARGESMVGTMLTKTCEHTPAMWMSYILVDDLAEMHAACLVAEAESIRESTVLAGHGAPIEQHIPRGSVKPPGR